MTADLVVSWLEGTPWMIGSLRDVTLRMPFRGWLFFLVMREWHALKLLEFFAQLQALKGFFRNLTKYWFNVQCSARC